MSESTRSQGPPKRLALVSGGGSGGHVFPGLAVARELMARGWTVAWIGRPDSLESRLLARQEDIGFHGIPALPLVGRGPLSQIRSVLMLVRSTVRARHLVRRLGPHVVLGTGGYASVPAVLGARLAGVPTVLLEPNAEAGMANRLLSRFVSEATVAHDRTAGGLRCPATTTGVPVRAEFFDVTDSLPNDEPLHLLVLGGSQGARSLNEALPEAVASLRLGGPLFVRHQTGAAHVESTYRRWNQADIEVCSNVDGSGPGWRPDGPSVQVEVTPFLSDVAGAMAESHLILSRAGAITLAEICAAGRASLLLPLALAGGHQEANARRLEDAGAAEVLVHRATPGEVHGTEAFQAALSTVLGTLLADPERLASMAAKAHDLGRRAAAGAIADRLETRALEARRNGESGAWPRPATKGGTV
ncbi:MAG: UDP-N-acetylglucosamine--N-acetylmuramyl-(pentapeptide) pyrophosphoryl-undecaprenol N-acetylglucosamine transferase [Thermoanaerobaculia bacterium]|nr:UDP-N-acetylglucosamine--N-acetylmuramyl-(pentapeptide) pyrophosphoryl-undecaprenol N-acetylglucosamine transferase [Thermoanaerobaculia bacterium]